MARRSTRDSDRSVPADDVDDWDVTYQIPRQELFRPDTHDARRLQERTRTAVIVLLVLLGAVVSVAVGVWSTSVELGIFIVSSHAGMCTLGLKWYFKNR
jgi:hypothetical protein